MAGWIYADIERTTAVQTAETLDGSRTVYSTGLETQNFSGKYFVRSEEAGQDPVAQACCNAATRGTNQISFNNQVILLTSVTWTPEVHPNCWLIDIEGIVEEGVTTLRSGENVVNNISPTVWTSGEGTGEQYTIGVDMAENQRDYMTEDPYSNHPTKYISTEDWNIFSEPAVNPRSGASSRVRRYRFIGSMVFDDRRHCSRYIQQFTDRTKRYVLTDVVKDTEGRSGFLEIDSLTTNQVDNDWIVTIEADVSNTQRSRRTNRRQTRPNAVDNRFSPVNLNEEVSEKSKQNSKPRVPKVRKKDRKISRD